jgi:molybdopterin adenylyltransferase
VRAGVLTVSDGVHQGVREDLSGDTLDELLQGEGFDVVRGVVPDEQGAIADAIRDLADDDVLLVLTTGGTGFAPRDVTRPGLPRRSAPMRSREHRTRSSPVGSRA